MLLGLAHDATYHAVHASFTGREEAGFVILVAISERDDGRRDQEGFSKVQVTVFW